MRAAEAIEAATPRRSLRSRDLQPEWMDDPALDAREHALALAGLARLNRVSRSHAPLWCEIRAAGANPNRPLRLLDVATGGGDVLGAILRRASREGVSIEATGCDISATALEIARLRAPQASFVRIDVVRQPLPRGFDIAMCSLFLHHLDEEQTIMALRRLGEAARVVLVSDLARSRIGLALAWAASRALTRSRIVHVDALLSVRAAYAAPELRRIAEAAGLRRVRIRRVWPERLLLIGEGVA